ncbi:MAG: ATP-binding protein [Eggerthella lenta]
MLRKIIEIDETACNGCACASRRAVSAIGWWRARRLLRDDYCDRLGDCLPACRAPSRSWSGAQPTTRLPGQGSNSAGEFGRTPVGRSRSLSRFFASKILRRSRPAFRFRPRRRTGLRRAPSSFRSGRWRSSSPVQ